MIVLTAKTYNGAPTDAISASFDELGGTIGRTDNNQLVLPDRERTVSRVHAQVLFRNGSYLIQDRGSNPISVNGCELGKGREQPIQTGDSVQVGGYVLIVSAGSSTVSSKTNDPFAEFFGDREAAARSILPVEAPRGVSTIPDDWDVFAAPNGSNSLDLTQPKDARNVSLHAPLIPASGSDDSLEQLFGLSSSRVGDPLHAGMTPLQTFPPHVAQHPQQGATADVDPLSAFLKSGESSSAPIPDDVPDLRTPWVQKTPQIQQIPPGAVLSWEVSAHDAQSVAAADVDLARSTVSKSVGINPVRPATLAPDAAAQADMSSITGNHDALLAAFLEGLGAPELRLEVLTPGLMNRIGHLLRESAHGTIELLAARAALKREVRAKVTMIIAKENNPLKFSPSVEVALQHMLGPQAKGFMPPIAAVRDAYDDLRGHQIGMLAGMRAALEGLLARFDPARLEAQLAPRTGLAGLIPAARKSRLWESFESLHTQLSVEAEDEFHDLFGKAFVAAYETHLDQLHRDDASK